MTKYLVAIFTLSLVLNLVLSAKSLQFGGRIINGDYANEEHTFAVRIISAESSVSPTGTVRSGVAITPNHVVTVAHAIVGYGIWFVDYGSIHVLEQYETVTIDATAHPDYDPVFLHNNIGVIRVSDDISTNIPIVLPEVVGFVFGYGVVDPDFNLALTLKKASVINMPDISHCVSLFNEYVVRSDNICSPVVLSSIASGDQGGPVTNNDFTGVSGIVSFWSEDGSVAVLTNLNEHLDFIISQTTI